MDGLSAGIDGPLVVIRALHFAVTAMTAGILIFRAVVVGTDLCMSTPAGSLVRARTLRLTWIGLGLALVSGMIWLPLVAASMSGLSLREAMDPEVLLTVLNQTQFVQVAEVPLALSVIL